jgi:hypothetical protein
MDHMRDDLASLSSSTRADSVQQHERRPAAQVVLSVKPPVVHTMQKVRHGEMYLTVTPAHQKCNKKERRKEGQHRVYDRLAKDKRRKKKNNSHPRATHQPCLSRHPK